MEEIEIFRIAKICMEHARLRTLSAREIQSTLQIMYPDNRDLLSEGTRAVANYNAGSGTYHHFNALKRKLKLYFDRVGDSAIYCYPLIERRLITID